MNDTKPSLHKTINSVSIEQAPKIYFKLFRRNFKSFLFNFYLFKPVF